MSYIRNLVNEPVNFLRIVAQEELQQIRQIINGNNNNIMNNVIINGHDPDEQFFDLPHLQLQMRVDCRGMLLSRLQQPIENAHENREIDIVVVYDSDDDTDDDVIEILD